jgi:predicted nuclease of predicted toxin-antitoxin system
MKILADECLPVRIKSLFPDFILSTVNELGWSGLKNGDLLKKAVIENFEIFLTVDKKIIYQQNISNYKIGFIIIDVTQNKLEEIVPLKELVIESLQTIKPFEIVQISSSEGIKKINIKEI